MHESSKSIGIDKIPIVVGVTGHRNIVEEDKAAIKKQVIESLVEIKNLCKCKDGQDTPIIMLNAFAQGADMLCAEAAFELGIDVYAVLPCEKEKYIRSFDCEIDKEKLDNYLSRSKRQFVAPDIEKSKVWIKNTTNIYDDSYEYRQLGIYIAKHSHILIALWDGKPPKVEYGCGTVEVIKFALEHKFLDKDKLFKPGIINDSAVVWIKARRQGDGAEVNVQKKWLISKYAGDEGDVYDDYLVIDHAPAFLKNIIKKTICYNAENFEASQDSVKLWENLDELDEYHKSLRLHYEKSDDLSYLRNQKKYNYFIFLLALIGTVVACTFLIYDDASLPFMIFPCTIAIVIILCLVLCGKRKAYHKKYVEYRAFAEALRIQFYMTLCLAEKPPVTNVCDLYAWSQKMDMIWIGKAIQALGVICCSGKINIDPTEVIDVWIGNNEQPTGQLRYHSNKKSINKKKAKTYKNLSKSFQVVTICMYFIIFIMEIITYVLNFCQIDWYWKGNIFAQISWRNFAAILLGTVTAWSLLASGYWGKLSYGRKVDDNEKMYKFYSSAFVRWGEVKKHNAEIEKFVKEIAQEEIVENGIWCSYVSENGLEINI